MAWYHVNGCDCPIGCCDCGEPLPKQVLKGKDLKHLDPVTFEMVKNGICPSCLTTEQHCYCGEI